MTGDPGEPLSLETMFRQRLPGFDEATYARALAYADQVREDEGWEDD